MLQKNSPKQVINNYKKKQQSGPKIIALIAVLLVVVGLGLLLFWLFGSGGPRITLFATQTPTPTLTFTPTNTSIPTSTPTVTETPTNTATPTPSAPYEYVIKEGDYLYSIVESQGLGPDGLALIFLLNPTIDSANPNIQVGQTILLPNPGMQLPTATPIPSDLAPGTRIVYTIEAGDSLASIAAKFNSTVEAILALKDNKDAGLTLTDPIYVGQKITVPVNVATPVPTQVPTTTPVAETPTVTPTP